MKTIATLFAGAAALAVSAGARAETETAADTIIVTALRIPTMARNTGVQISVLDEAQIADRQTSSVAELLSTLPGVTYDRSGSFGGVSAVRIRGAEGAQTLVLLDGVRMNDVAEPAAGFDFGTLMTGNIDRIEVLRGSQSVLWGSQAIGGVVNLVTREPTETLSIRVRAEYGYADTARGYADVAGTNGPVAWSLGGGYDRTDGISSADRRDGNPERDGFRGASGRVKLRITVADNVSLDLRGNYLDTRFDFDGFPCCAFTLADTEEYGKNRSFNSYAGLNVGLFDGKLRNRIAWSRADNRRRIFDPENDAFDPTVPEENFRSRGKSDRFEYQGNLAFSDALDAVFGYEHEKSRFVTRFNYGGFTGGDRATTNSDSIYLRLNTRPVEGLAINVGARHDWHAGFGKELTLGADAAYSPNGGQTTLRASYGEGFKAPTLYQLYGDYGNTLLQPESAKSWDIGIIQSLLDGQLELSATVFERRTRNQIDFINCPALTGICTDRPDGTYDNIARARARGTELAVRMQPTEAFTVEASYTYTKAVNRAVTDPNFGKDLRRRPRDSFSLRADYAWTFGLKTGATIRMVGDNWENNANTRQLDSYVVTDMTARYALTDQVEITGRIENLFDSHYQTARGYGSFPRAAYIGVRFGM